jgi:hypothetical protein
MEQVKLKKADVEMLTAQTGNIPEVVIAIEE